MRIKQKESTHKEVFSDVKNPIPKKEEVNLIITSPQPNIVLENAPLKCPKCKKTNFVNIKQTDYHCKDCGYNSSGFDFKIR